LRGIIFREDFSHSIIIKDTGKKCNIRSAK